jgi:hypothetical protein
MGSEPDTTGERGPDICPGIMSRTSDRRGRRRIVIDFLDYLVKAVDGEAPDVNPGVRPSRVKPAQVEVHDGGVGGGRVGVV